MRVSASVRSLQIALLLCLAHAPGCSDGREARPSAARSQVASIRLEVGSVPIQADVAMSRSARARGLSGVSFLPADKGMLFVYPTDQRLTFWMKGCVIALDIAFLDAAGRVLQVDTVQPPASPEAALPTTRRSPPSAYVLEVQAGFFKRHRLGVGTLVLIPPTVNRSSAE